MITESYLNKLQNNKSIGVDLDGTLAHYIKFDPNHIGDPIPKMIDRVKQWISNGIRIKIFTARATDPKNIPAIKQWLDKNGLEGLEITNIKDPDMIAIFDDRAIQVEKNTGEILGDISKIKGI